MQTLVLDLIGITAVGAPRGLLGVRRCDRQDLPTPLKVREHRAALAGLHVEEKLLEHAVFLHGLNGAGELFHMQYRAVWKGYDSHTTMVHKIQEDIVVWAALQYLPICRHARRVTGDHAEEELCCHNFASVINLAARVHILNIIAGLVEELPWEWILLRVCNIVLHHQDDVFFRDATFLHNLVCVACISLVPVVHVTRGACSNHRILGSL
mmetsp:Transcript_144308/g.268994  ORF Transcript_144308/g.268994 Transcript_144308/m.268994 type:complete len:210 (-) Transcript_144308:110-739(-)